MTSSTFDKGSVPKEYEVLFPGLVGHSLEMFFLFLAIIRINFIVHLAIKLDSDLVFASLLLLDQKFFSHLFDYFFVFWVEFLYVRYFRL